MKKNIWIPIDQIKTNYHYENPFPDNPNFLVRTKEGKIGFGFIDYYKICYTTLNPDDETEDMKFFISSYKDDNKLKEIMFISNYRKDSPLWYSVSEHSIPKRMLLLAYNKEWNDCSIWSYPSGIRLGYMTKYGNEFHSIRRCNNYERDENEKFQYLKTEGDDYNSESIVFGYRKMYFSHGRYIDGWRPNMPEYWRFIPGTV